MPAHQARTCWESRLGRVGGRGSGEGAQLVELAGQVVEGGLLADEQRRGPGVGEAGGADELWPRIVGALEHDSQGDGERSDGVGVV